MRNRIFAGFVTTLMAASMLTMTACNSRGEPVDTEPVDSSSSSITQVMETSEFLNSNYRKNFYSQLFSEEKYKEVLAGLTPVEGVYTQYGHKQVYKDSEGIMSFISGYMPISIDKAGNASLMFLEELGNKMYSCTSENVELVRENIKLAQSLVTEDFMNLDKVKDLFVVNNVKVEFEDKLLAEEVGDGTYALNLINTLTSANATIDIDESTKSIKFIIDPIVSPIYEVEILYSDGYDLILEQGSGNSYYTARYDSATGDLFVPTDVIKNILGWECNYIAEYSVACIYTNDVYVDLGYNLYKDQDSYLVGITETPSTVTPVEGLTIPFLNEKGSTITVKESSVKKPNIGTPVKQEKPASTAKPSTSSKPTTEKPKPSTPAPTYTNVWGGVYTCDGKEFNPDCLPPTDGNRWCWSIDPVGWWWDDVTSETEQAGWDGLPDVDSANNDTPPSPNVIR